MPTAHATNLLTTTRGTTTKRRLLLRCQNSADPRYGAALAAELRGRGRRLSDSISFLTRKMPFSTRFFACRGCLLHRTKRAINQRLSVRRGLVSKSNGATISRALSSRTHLLGYVKLALITIQIAEIVDRVESRGVVGSECCLSPCQCSQIHLLCFLVPIPEPL
jgi:hypothetical protein